MELYAMVALYDLITSYDDVERCLYTSQMHSPGFQIYSYAFKLPSCPFEMHFCASK